MVLKRPGFSSFQREVICVDLKLRRKGLFSRGSKILKEREFGLRSK